MVEKCPYSKEKKENETTNKRLAVFSEDREDNKPNSQVHAFDALSVNSTQKTVDLSDNENINTISSYNNTNKKEKCPFKEGQVINNSKCPYSGKTIEEAETNSKNNCPYKDGEKLKDKPDEAKKDDDDLSDDEEQQGGCPVMNTKKNDPQNKHFNSTWELPFFGPFDFMFDLRGLLNEKEFLEKTKKLRSYPRHLLYTLFNQNDEKLNKVREKEFPLVFFIYDDIKIKGNKFYRKGKTKEALDHYFYVSIYYY